MYIAQKHPKIRQKYVKNAFLLRILFFEKQYALHTEQYALHTEQYADPAKSTRNQYAVACGDVLI